MSIYGMTEQEHERAVKEYLYKEFDEHSQKLAMTAFKDLLKNGKNWEWLHYAILKKSKDKWMKYGWGLMFNWDFDGSVKEAINRDKKLEETKYSDVEEWLLEDEIERKKYEYELKNSIDIGAGIEYNRNGAQKQETMHLDEVLEIVNNPRATKEAIKIEGGYNF